MKISELIKNPDNPRTITEAKRKMLLKALRRFGDLSGIVFNRKTGRLVGGHQRRDVFDPATPITVTKKYSNPTKTGTVAEGHIEVRGERFTYREVYWDEPTEKAATIAANKGAGEWDPAKLETWIKDLNGFDVNFDLELTMFDADEIKDITGIEVKGYTRTNAQTGVDEDEVPEKPPAQTKLGDIYVLGRHRLVCGDSTASEVVERLLAGKKIDLVFTDPPYNIDYQGVKDKREKIKNDKMPDEEFVEFLKKSIPGAPVIYCCCSWQYVHLFRRALAEIEKPAKAMIVWDKVNPAQHLDRYFKQHELILYHGPFGGQETVRGDIWQIKRQQNTLHPTMKPGELVQLALDDNLGVQNVFDGFGGSGTTMIACEKTARSCYTAELDPAYCDVIVARWEKYTGLEAKLIRTETKRKANGMAKVRANGESKSKAAAQA